MIQIDSSIEPEYLRSATITDAIDRIEVRVKANQKPYILKTEDYWRNEKVTDKLHETHIGKCCYCERRRDRKRDMDVDHYRPKGEVAGDTVHTGYWWRAYKWNNLLWSCHTCNQKYKGTKFTLLPGGTRAYDKMDDLILEKPNLINPKLEDPSKLLSFQVDRSGGRCFITILPRAGINNSKQIRANETIRIVGLNRHEHGYNLVEERGEKFYGTDFEWIVLHIIQSNDAKDKNPEKRQDYIESINALREQLKKFIRPNREFSGVFRDYLRCRDIEYESLL